MRITGNSLQTVIIYPLSGKVLEPVYIKCILQYNKLHLLFIPFPSSVINSIVIFNMDSTEHFKSSMCSNTKREGVPYPETSERFCIKFSPKILHF
jgi:hypothetical protein